MQERARWKPVKMHDTLVSKVTLDSIHPYDIIFNIAEIIFNDRKTVIDNHVD